MIPISSTDITIPEKERLIIPVAVHIQLIETTFLELVTTPITFHQKDT